MRRLLPHEGTVILSRRVIPNNLVEVLYQAASAMNAHTWIDAIAEFNSGGGLEDPEPSKAYKLRLDPRTGCPTPIVTARLAVYCRKRKSSGLRALRAGRKAGFCRCGRRSWDEDGIMQGKLDYTNDVDFQEEPVCVAHEKEAKQFEDPRISYPVPDVLDEREGS